MRINMVASFKIVCIARLLLRECYNESKFRGPGDGESGGPQVSRKKDEFERKSNRKLFDMWGTRRPVRLLLPAAATNVKKVLFVTENAAPRRVRNMRTQ